MTALAEGGNAVDLSKDRGIGILHGGATRSHEFRQFIALQRGIIMVYDGRRIE